MGLGVLTDTCDLCTWGGLTCVDRVGVLTDTCDLCTWRVLTCVDGVGGPY